jgi:hypothetical protein
MLTGYTKRLLSNIIASATPMNDDSLYPFEFNSKCYNAK